MEGFRNRLIGVSAVLAWLALSGCSSDGDTGSTGGASGAGSGGTAGADAGGGAAGAAATGGNGGAVEAGPFELTSTAFVEGATIPTIHECGPQTVPNGPGQDVSPPLAWTPGPEGTQSYALVMQDIDSSVIHWVVYDIPATASSLPQGIVPGYAIGDPSGAKQAELQGSGYFGYFGPCSPGVVNTYRFTLYAMPTATLAGATMQSSETELAASIPAASIASAALAGES